METWDEHDGEEDHADATCERIPRPTDSMWWPREKAAAVLDISVRQFDAAIRPLIPAHYVHKHGRNVDIFAPALSRAFLAWQRRGPWTGAAE